MWDDEVASMREGVVIGLDVGTTNCKAIALNYNGEIVAARSQEYSILEVKPGWFEQNPEDVLNSVKEVLHDVSTDCDGNVLAISLSVQGEAVIPLSRRGDILHNAILGMDRRCHEQNEYLKKVIGEETLYYETGMPIHTINTLPKILWIKDKMPDLFKNTSHFVLYEDFLIHWLTGEFIVSDCLISRTQMFSIKKKNWYEKTLELLGERFEKKLSRVLPSGKIVGKVKKELCTDLGFRTIPVVVTGGHDQACASLGAGVIDDGYVLSSTGTADVLEICSNEPLLDVEMLKSGFSTYLHCAPNKYLNMYVNHVGGVVLKWLKELFDGQIDYNELLSTSRNSSLYPIMIPLAEETSYDFLLAVNLGADKHALAFGIVEGLTFHISRILKMITKKVPVKKVVCVGGGTRSEYWNQLKADMMGIAVSVPSNTNTAPLGAAILAGVASGFFKDIEDALKTIKNPHRVIYPRDNDKSLEEKYEKFLEFLSKKFSKQ